MSYRVQFTISEKEQAELQAEAKKMNYPSVSALCYARSLPNSTTKEMFERLVKLVKDMDNEEPFVIRELFPNERIPAVLGKFFAEGVKNGTIPNVKALGRNKTLGADAYQKVLSLKDE